MPFWFRGILSLVAFAALISIIMVVMPHSAQAVLGGKIPNCGTNCTAGDIANGLVLVANVLTGLAGGIGLVYLVIGGFEYISSAGDSGLVSTAKGTVWHATFGLILTLGAWALIQGVVYLITGGNL